MLAGLHGWFDVMEFSGNVFSRLTWWCVRRICCLWCAWERERLHSYHQNGSNWICMTLHLVIILSFVFLAFRYLCSCKVTRTFSCIRRQIASTLSCCVARCAIFQSALHKSLGHHLRLALGSNLQTVSWWNKYSNM